MVNDSLLLSVCKVLIIPAAWGPLVGVALLRYSTLVGLQGTAAILLVLTLLVPFIVGAAYRLTEPDHYLGSAMLQASLWHSALILAVPLGLELSELGVPLVGPLARALILGAYITHFLVGRIVYRRMKDAAEQVYL